MAQDSGKRLTNSRPSRWARDGNQAPVNQDPRNGHVHGIDKESFGLLESLKRT